MFSPDVKLLKMILSTIFRDLIKWSHDDSSANQMSQFLFVYKFLPYNVPRIKRDIL
jgi:hypothetical protein